MKLIQIEDCASDKISDAKSLLEENGFNCSYVEFENLAGLDKLIAVKELQFQVNQLEQQISELESLYQTLSKRVRGFVKMELPSCKYSIADKFLEHLSGFSVEKWLETPNFVSSIVHPKFKDYFLSCCDEMKRGVIPKVMDYKIIRKDGEERWWLQFNIGAYNIDGKLVSVSAIIIDNTDRKITELKLKESEERFRSLVEQSVAGIVIVKDEKIIFANDVVFKHSGYSQSTISSMRFEDLEKIIHPDDFDFVMEQFRKVEEKELVPEFYYRIISPCKKVKWLSSQLKKFSHENGSTIAVIMVEVTKRVELEQKLRRERNLAQKYFDVAGTLLVVLDKDCKVVQINKRGCAILKYPKEEIIGKNWIDNFLPESIRETVRIKFAKAIAGEVSSQDDYENYILTENGEERLISWKNAILLNEDNEIEAIISSGEDITQQRLAEELLQKNDYLKRL